MAGAALSLMAVDEFLAWSLDQEARHELIEGVPVEMMTGANGLQDLIVTNSIAVLKSQLRGGPSQPTTADIAVRTRIRSVRRPDVTVTCDPPRGDAYEAIEPKLVVEVLSPSNKGVAWDRKMREYRRMTHLDYILLVDAETVAATLYCREGSEWNDVDAETLADVLELSKLGCRPMMTEIYDGTGFSPAPVAEGR